MGGAHGMPVPPPTAQGRLLLAASLVVAMVLPSLTTAVYFVGLAADTAGPNGVQLVAFAGGKVAQFVLPLLVVLLLQRRLPRPRRPRFDGLALGAGFGLLVVAAMFALYYGWLADSSILSSAPDRVWAKVTQLGLNYAPGIYWVVAAGYAVGHALFEEYYFRWFIFGQLRKLLPFAPAAVVASVAFMAHHVILLYVYLPGNFFRAAVPLSLCIAVGGLFWCWLYERTGTIYSAWVSHGIIDAAIFVLGWILLQRA
jgi:membrane protease YdiL (CAAX protease family)